MSNRQLAILGGVAAVMLLVTVVLYSADTTSEQTFREGAALIQGLAPENVHSIAIRSESDTVTLRRNGAGFTVKERGDYPASVERINDLLVRCLDIRCAEKITESPQNHGELGVADDSPDALAVQFLGADGQMLIGFVKGKSAPGGRGPYVRLLGQDAVYAAERYLYVDASPMAYVDKSLVEVERGKITRVAVRAGEESYTLTRGEDGNALLGEVPEGKRVVQMECDSVLNALSRLGMTDVEAVGERDVVWTGTYTCALESGLTYTVRSAVEDGQHYVRLSADAPQVNTVEITRTESDEELKKKEAVLLAAETAAKFNVRHGGWTYHISSWDAQKLTKPLDELVEDIPVAEGPEEVGARHILISYQGAERSESERSKEEAGERAEEVLARARAEGADFAALAEEYSDGPTAGQGGDLGTFGRGAMAPAFEEAAFALEVGDISDVVETPFGFHVIKRTE